MYDFIGFGITPAWDAQKRESTESWRLSRAELRMALDSYEKAIHEDACNLLRPTEEERSLMGEVVLKKRADNVMMAQDANRRFVQSILDDLPDDCQSSDSDVPLRPVCEFRELSPGSCSLTDSFYGSLASVNLHLLRDWSMTCENVCASTYDPTVSELKQLLPSCCGEVLVPGCGLGRLAFAIARLGFSVEANEVSRPFLTVADYVLNRSRVAATIFPVAHVFSENWSLGEQYIEIEVPMPMPSQVRGESPGTFVMVPGDFMKTYSPGCPGYRKFDAIVTCFFIDTSADPCKLFRVLDGLLKDGGVWVNVGPLNWRKESKLKLAYDEVIAIWENMGYEFVSRKKIDCDYHLPKGIRMYTESYQCALTAAIKRSKLA